MSMVIGTNLASLSAQRALGEAQSAQQTAMERLSTGKRINSAADDAAGLAIAQKFTAQVKGLNQAVKNGQQASALAGTAEGALQEVSDILQRMRELTVQAANSTLSATDRTAIKAELTTLTAEIDRISKDTTYNGQTLLDGSAKSLQFQVGDSGNSLVKFSLDSASSAGLGVGTGSASGGGSVVDGIAFGEVVAAANSIADTISVDGFTINGHDMFGAVEAGNVTHVVNGVTTTTAMVFEGTSAAYHLALAISANSHNHGVEATARTVLEGEIAGGVTDGGLTIAVGGTTHTIRATNSMDDLVSAVNGIGLVATKNEAGGIRMEDTLGRTITIGGTNAIEQTGIADVTQNGFLTLRSLDGSAFTIADGADADNDQDESLLEDIGLVKGTFGGGSDGNTYEITGAHIHAGTTITAATDFTINGVQVGPTSTGTAAANISAMDLRDSVNAVSSQTGVTATAENRLFIQIAAHTTAGASNYDGIDALLINGTTITPGANNSFVIIAGTINTAMIAAGSDIRATVTNANNGTIQLLSESGQNIILKESNADDNVIAVFREDGDDVESDGTTGGGVDAISNTYTGRLTFSSTTGPITFGATSDDTSVNQATADGVAALFGVRAAGDINGSSSGGSGVNVSSASAASASLTALDSAITRVSGMRSDIGALQNRLAFTIANLETVAQSHERSRSLVEDTDYAVESANLAKAQVLAQAGTAMLSQANAAPQLALQLLQ